MRQLFRVWVLQFEEHRILNVQASCSHTEIVKRTKNKTNKTEGKKKCENKLFGDGETAHKNALSHSSADTGRQTECRTIAKNDVSIAMQTKKRRLRTLSTVFHVRLVERD